MNKTEDIFGEKNYMTFILSKGIQSSYLYLYRYLSKYI